MTTTLETARYYASLLILQYALKTKAYATVRAQATPVIMPQATVQTVTFSVAPSTGVFVLSYLGVSAAPIAWDATAADVQTALQAIPGLGAVTVTGSIAGLELVVTFTGVTPIADLLVVEASTLDADITIGETDLTLPLAVQDGFNLTGDNTAVGVQLDVLGKYAGVTRTGPGFTTAITLDDADFLNLILFAVIKNSSGSSLFTIQSLLLQFFGTEVTVVDYADMFMSFYVSSAIGSTDFLQLVIGEGLLPVPMAVGNDIIIYDSANAFGFADSINSGGFGDATDPSIGGEFASLYPP